MDGVSGAFLLLPFQMSFLGYVNPSVSATNQLFNIVAIPSGVYRYYRRGAWFWPLTWVVVIGTCLVFSLAPSFVSPTHGRMANTRAGKPDPSFGFGKVATTRAPASGTSCKFVRSSI